MWVNDSLDKDGALDCNGSAWGEGRPDNCSHACASGEIRVQLLATVFLKITT